MNYIIQKQIGGFRYYLKAKEPKWWKSTYSWEGLINNATCFTKDHAEGFKERRKDLKSAEIVPLS